MYHQVQTKEEHFVFEQLWGDFCEERNLLFIERHLNPERFLLISDENKAIGAIECAKYEKVSESNAEFFYPFSSHITAEERIVKKIYEIGKLTIQRQCRGYGHFKRLLAILFIHAIEMKASMYIAVVTKRMYMYLRFLGFPMKKLDEEFSLNEHIIGIPIMIDAFEGIKHMYSIKEFRDIIKTNANAVRILDGNDNNIM